ncbi:fimbrial protein [Klebsiella sp. BIGb0407]|uniref:fimbrial protein n=1 Tax=Klebsiella sp. BIGb0407 TaxID=2940603 RepID=UPI00216735CB|nr:fimbrial protein [Klebsiella sp. BIGb0407]MCS3429668.1 major type 1 subunit fimbrin (pilin) [Klebsiella sp. BIGb0407]
MKKLALVVSLAAVFGSVNLAQAAGTGTITFNGELTASTCDVTIDGQGADATVVLPTQSTSLLDAATKTAGETGFVMALNNCTGTLQTASAFFDSGSSVEAVTGRLKNISGSATNVSLQLIDGSSPSRAVIQAGNQNQTSGTSYVDVSSGSANLPYAVRYYAEGVTGPGTVVSNVVYSIQYQ